MNGAPSSPAMPAVSAAPSPVSLHEELAKGADISIVALLECLIRQASSLNASDIHIDPAHEKIRIRMRIDGVLQDLECFPKSIHSEVISRIKVLSGLRTDEHQTAQDGRFRHLLEGGKFVDIRVSIVPTYHGENAVLRLLSDHSADYSLDMLGFSPEDRKKIEAAAKKTSGMILATGPTGSGKTTTLYTLLKMLNSPEVSIITIEDPVEYAVEDIEQIQVNSRTGLTFANGLRSILRQDPDIIMVGEIRDAETANIAVNTALTGHLLLSTLHTNDAATTLPRLSDMGIDPYLVASTINIAIGQRLVRKICSGCKKPVSISQAAIESLAELSPKLPFASDETIYKGAGCDACNGSGYKGRVCINEVLVATPALREAILRKASSDEIRRVALADGMTTMLDDGFDKVRKGETTIEEVLRVVHE